MPQVVKKGQPFYCSVCGSEVTVIRAGRAVPTPVCCEKLMIARPVLLVFFHCAICGSEVVVIRGSAGHLAPVCCNQPMDLQGAA
jgi:desulfoferrodoxin-like iron-binding protein